MNLKG